VLEGKSVVPATVLDKKFFFKCVNDSCSGEFDPMSRLYQCPLCGDLLDIHFEFPDLDPDDLKRTFRLRRASNQPLDVSGVWRFREFLPFFEEDYRHVITMGEGNSQILEAPLSAQFAGLKRLRVKQLGWNPTGSFKDYGMTVAATQASKLGSRLVACASTGNTSASMAAYCARSTNLKAVVFIPEGQISYGKLSQTLDYGALTIQIEGDFDRAMGLVREIAEERDVYLMNSINPFRLEGQKAIILELFDQLDWIIPDRILVPGGNLGNSSSFGKALIELKMLGFLEKLPRVTIIQAAGAAPLFNMLESGLAALSPVEKASTLASAIKIGNPVSWKKALRSLEFSDGWCERVSDQEIADAKAVLGRDGIGCEPASAATVAGLKRMAEIEPGDPEMGRIERDEDVVALLTGHQLKDSDYTVHYHMGDLELPEDMDSELLLSSFANRPVRVGAEKEQLVRTLDSVP
jgi:threonine synthase